VRGCAKLRNAAVLLSACWFECLDCWQRWNHCLQAAATLPACPHCLPCRFALHTATQAASLLAWSTLPASERWQRVGSVAVQLAFLSLPWLVPALYLRWRRPILIVERIQFFMWPLLRQPKGDNGTKQHSMTCHAAFVITSFGHCLCCVAVVQAGRTATSSCSIDQNAGIQESLNNEPKLGARGALQDLLRSIWVRCFGMAACCCGVRMASRITSCCTLGNVLHTTKVPATPFRSRHASHCVPNRYHLQDRKSTRLNSSHT